MKDDALLRLDHIAYQYRGADRPSLDDVSLAIGRGQIFGLLGPNGAGKTTLISLIAGLLPPQQGRFILDAGPKGPLGGPCTLEESRRAAPTAIALVPQDNAVYPMLTVLENLQFYVGV
ncbi:ATP-binding cassette domain-containing protein, partial [Leptospira sp. SA-E8]|uniref:ATP-binding cassette domain-containing protein n=1 Tax=Leptospira sp. SA-E8 TaxID=3422259 RepID=UPI003EBEA46F